MKSETIANQEMI